MIRAICLAAMTAVLLSLGLNVPAQADDATQPGKLMLVLDSSGSMKEKSGGTTKIAAAKEALGAVIDKLPAEQEVGLRVYGAKVFSAKDKGACTDSQRAVDLGTDNRTDLKGAVAKYKPYGETPTGYALQQAGKDLGKTGQRTIVLVSDGESTCSPDPCVAAKALAKDGIQLRIDVVGLDVSGKARAQLKCVATAGNGTYYDADDAKSLTDSLTTTSVRASRPFDLTGTPVKGSPQVASAPTIKTGQYLDTFGADDGLWYQVKRTVPGSTIHAGITHFSVGTGNLGDSAYIGVYGGPDEDRCGYEQSFARGRIAYASSHSWTKSADDACRTGDTVWVNVHRVSSRRDFTGEPVELVIYEEPPVKGDTSALTVPKKPTWSTITPGSPTTDIVPGSSISSAPVLSDGTYGFDINPGEVQVVAVPLDWGQNLQAQIDGRLTSEHTEHWINFDEPWIQVLGPIRQAVDTDDYGVSDKPKDWTGPVTIDDTSYRRGSQSYGVGYANRGEISEGASGSALSGLRYVQVSYGGDNTAPMEYSLTLKTNGKAGEGAPSYEKVAGLFAPSADSPLVTGVGSVSDALPAENESKTDKKKDDDGGGLPVLPIGLGVIGLALIGGAYTLLRKARSS